MDDKNLKTAVSVDYAMIAAINSLAVALRVVPGFDSDIASRMIDTFIQKPISPDIPDLVVYERVLESVRFHLKHPLEPEEVKAGNVVPLFAKEHEQSGKDHPQD